MREKFHAGSADISYPTEQGSNGKSCRSEEMPFKILMKLRSLGSLSG